MGMRKCEKAKMPTCVSPTTTTTRNAFEKSTWLVMQYTNMHRVIADYTRSSKNALLKLALISNESKTLSKDCVIGTTSQNEVLLNSDF